MQLGEAARRSIRAIAPRPVYFGCATVFGDLMVVLRMGSRHYVRLRQARRVRGPELVAFHAPGIAHPVWLRPATTDVSVFENNLVRQSYACARLTGSVRLILDAGANAGYASAYFLNAYPDADVVALEPDPDNAALARLNLAPYGARVRLIEAAIWPRPATLRIVMADRRDSVRVEETFGDVAQGCRGIDPLAAVAHAEGARINLFKCDIEGAEEQLFSDDADRWLDRTDCIVIELHGRRAAEIVHAATKRHGFHSKRYRDLCIFERAKAAQ